MVRFTVPLIAEWRSGETNAVTGSWERFFERGGIQFPWLTRLGQVTPGEPWFESPLLAYSILVLTLAACCGIWSFGARAERALGR